MTNSDSVTGVILAGGRGSRMQDQDKGLLEAGGRSLVEHLLERLAPQVDGILISANRNLERYRALGWPVVKDTMPDYPGPLAGLLGAMRAAPAGHILSVPCDAPLLPANYRQRMCTTMDNAMATVAHDAHGMQPVFALLDTRLADGLEDFLQGGGRKTADWMTQQQAVAADFSDQPDMFFNMNRPADHRRLQDILGNMGQAS